jgi:elongation factor G
MPAVESGIRESMANGVLNGYPIVDVRVELHDGSYHDTGSTDAAFREAAAMAFEEAAKKASQWYWSQSCRSS